MVKKKSRSRSKSKSRSKSRSKKKEGKRKEEDTEVKEQPKSGLTEKEGKPDAQKKKEEKKEGKVAEPVKGLKLETEVLPSYTAIVDINKTYRKGDQVPAHVVDGWKKRTIKVEQLVE